MVDSLSAIILAAQGVQDQEFWYPYYRLQEAEFYIEVFVSGKGEITGKYGIPIKTPNHTTSLKPKAHYDIVIVPGGWQAPEIMRQDKRVLEFLQHHNSIGTIIGTICHGPQVLISADIVKDVHMTCYKGMKDDLINAGANYHDQPVVIDKNIVSAQHYDNNPEWIKAVLQQCNV